MKLFIVIIVIFCSISLEANNWYVAKTGSNSNPGTYALPFLTIQKAADYAIAGDTVFIRGGTYQLYVIFLNSGTNTSPITIMPYQSEIVIVDGDNYALPSSGEWYALFNLAGNYINVSGLEVRYSAGMGVKISGTNCIATNMKVHHCRQTGMIITGNYSIVQNSTVYSACMNNEGGILTSSWATGLSAARSPIGAIIRNNIVHDVWGEGISTYKANGTVIEGNIIYDNWSANIYVSDATNIIVRRNLVYNTKSLIKGSMVGILMGDETCSPPSSVVSIVNNVVHDCKINFYRWGSACGTGMTNFLIANNTFVNSTSSCGVKFLYTTTNTNVQFRNNIVSQNGGLIPISIDSKQGITFSNNLWTSTPNILASGIGNVIGNPLFVSLSDFRLQASSPAINSGVNVELTTDLLGNSINGLPDIGAYEFRPSIVSISSPLSGAVFSAPATIAIKASVSDSNGSIAKVDFYQGSTLLGSDNTAAPYSFTWSNVIAGNYTITAKSTDNAGSVTISSPITIIVTTTNEPLPVVSILSPVSGAVFTAPASVTIAATASDADGSISKVDFYQGSTLLGSDNTSPYSFTWTNVLAGSYTITAKATGNAGATTISTPIYFTVVSAGGSVIISSAITASTDDVEESASGWIYTNSSDIELVYDSDNAPGNQTVGLRFINLAIPRNAVISNAYIQFTSKEVTTAACNLVIKGEASDNSPAFTIDYYDVSSRTKTLTSINWSPPSWSTAYVATTDQRTPNISSIIQEIVNRSGYTSSSAISLIITGSGTRNSVSFEGEPGYAAKLIVTYTIQGSNQPPVISVTHPTNGSTFSSPASVTISAAANDANGTITKVDFYQNSTLLSSDNVSPYSFTWTNVPSGTYIITCKATDNQGATTISLPYSISVLNAGISVNSSAAIATSVDDVEESSSGWVYTNSSDIELAYDVDNSPGNQKVGLRFANLAIPRNAYISNAYIQFTCDKATTGTCNLVINGEATDNSPAFRSTSYNVSSRTKTLTSVNWTPPAWSTVGEVTNYQRTPDISSIIQEIVNRSGYTLLSAISIIIAGNGTRTATSYEGSPDKAAMLFIQYTVPEDIVTPTMFKSGVLESPKISPPEKSKNLVCYPSPFTNQLNIEFVPVDDEGIITIEIFNSLGKSVMNRMHCDSNIAVLDIQNLASGIYIVRVRTSKTIYNKLVIKQ